MCLLCWFFSFSFRIRWNIQLRRRVGHGARGQRCVGGLDRSGFPPIVGRRANAEEEKTAAAAAFGEASEDDSDCDPFVELGDGEGKGSRVCRYSDNEATASEHDGSMPRADPDD